MIKGPIPQGSLPPHFLKKFKFFIYGATLLKMETQHFNMFGNTLVHHNVSFMK